MMMMMEGSMWIVVGVCVALPLLYLIWKHHPSYGANPGLPILPLLGCIPYVLLNKHRLYEWTCELFDRTPSLTRRVVVGRTTVISTADPQNLPYILKSNFECYPKGHSFFIIFADLFGNGIFNVDGPLWRFQRKVASYEFSSNSLREFVMEIADTEICNRLLPTLHAIHDSHRPFDLQALLMHYTFDTICQLTFGADPGCLDRLKVMRSMGLTETGAAPSDCADVKHDDELASNGEHDTKSVGDGGMPHDVVSHGTTYMKVPDDLIQGFVQGFQVALRATAERFLVPTFVWQAKRYFKIGTEKELLDSLDLVNKFTTFVIAQSKKELGNGKKRNDLLARFMQLSKPQVESMLEGQDEAAWKANTTEEQGQALSDSLLKDILLCFIFAGGETVASAVSFLIWLLCVHPRAERAVYEEIQEVLKLRALEPCGNAAAAKVGTFSFDELRKMHYLHAALSESMRLYPPVPADVKYAVRDDTLPDGTPIKKGWQVSYNVFAMGRAWRVWGTDCLDFRPERWLGKDGQFVPVSPYKYPVFQAGPRICLGKDFAFIQMKLLVASLLQNFEFEVVEGYKPQLSYGISLLMVNGLQVMAKRRAE